MASASLTAVRLREVLHYDPETGIFTRKVRTAQRHQVGDRADFLITGGGQKGYYRVSIDSRRYMAHRLAWFYMHGTWPTGEIDHWDTDRGNNRIANLRDVTSPVNKQNVRRPLPTNRSGFLGVYFAQNLWYAQVQFEGRRVWRKSFRTPEEAHAAYVIAKRKLHEGCTL